MSESTTTNGVHEESGYPQFLPSNIVVLLMEKISQEAVKLFKDQGFTVRQAVRFARVPVAVPVALWLCGSLAVFVYHCSSL